MQARPSLERLTLWRDADVAQGPRAYNGALALTVVVHQEGWQVLVWVVWYAFCRCYLQELDIFVLGCQLLQAGPHNLAAEHPAPMSISLERPFKSSRGWTEYWPDL